MPRVNSLLSDIVLSQECVYVYVGAHTFFLGMHESVLKSCQPDALQNGKIDNTIAHLYPYISNPLLFTPTLYSDIRSNRLVALYSTRQQRRLHIVRARWFLSNREHYWAPARKRAAGKSLKYHRRSDPCR